MAGKGIMAVLLGMYGACACADIGAGVEFGSTGYGVDLTYKYNETLDARLGYSRFEYSVDINTADIKYNGKARLSNFRALADWYWSEKFRLSGGFYLQNNKVNVSGKSYVINDVTYEPDRIGNTEGYGKFTNPIAPYLGIGYGRPAKRGWQFYADLGVLYQGTAKVSLSFTCANSLSASSCARLKSRTEKEQQDLYDKIKDYRFLPVLSAGVSYAF